ncbi:hypothetical protein Ciccas_001515 [Cichlidogyrus casuarinus]|uniref:Calpain catalytic domain-containing protein n=1 Tax=Cichlidogyrus casuarinus TaxID=1844966 RepID=A0ABD2QJU2_9PLAT
MGGDMTSAIEALTGGACETFTGPFPDDFATTLDEALQRKALVICIVKDSETGIYGLKNSLAHSVISITNNLTDQTETSDQLVSLVKIRNSTGSSEQWTGRWKIGGAEWTCLSEAEKRKVGYVQRTEGEYWMNVEDLSTAFQQIIICHLDVSILGLDTQSRKTGSSVLPWKMIQIHDTWRARVNSGGSDPNKETYTLNPLYRVTVRADPNNDNDAGSIVISLSIKDWNDTRGLSHGYSIYKICDINIERYSREFLEKQEIVYTSDLSNRKQQTHTHVLPADDYILITYTQMPNEDAQFLVQIYYQVNEEELKTATQKTGSIRSKSSAIRFNPVQRFEDKNNMITPAPSQESVPALTEEQAKELAKLHEFVTGSRKFLFAEDLVRIVNAALNHNFEISEMKVEPKESEYRAYAQTEAANGTNARKTKEPSKKSSKSGKSAPKMTTFITMETARSLISSVDSTESRDGRLTAQEFEGLWNLIRLWHHAFIRYRAQGVDSLDSFKLRSAFKEVGYQLDNDVYESVVIKFTNKNGEMHLNEFLRCCSKLKASFNIFAKAKNSSHPVVMSESTVSHRN